MTPEQAYYKAKKSGKRMPELELTISKDAQYSYFYARDVIKGRWELAEPAISKDALYSYYYARNIIKGKFISGEAVISKNARYSYWYAINVIKGKLPDFMHNQMILNNDEFAKEYVESIQ